MSAGTNQTGPTRLVPTGWDDDGNVVAESILSPTHMKVRAMCLVPSELVIPIIFVPGIMGTRLRVKDAPKKMAWSPPEHIWEGLWAALTGAFTGAATRQRLLDPRITDVDDNGASRPSDNAKALLGIAEGKNTAERAKWRGWGALHADSYGKILNALEEHFGMVFDPHTGGEKLTPWWRAQVMSRQDAHKTGAQKAFSPLTDTELKDAAEVLYPVHAVGYNWLQSNKDSGARLLDKIRQITQHYRGKGKFCEKVVIVTHSMGGLVARACAQEPGAADLIMGVVHGVMPAIGAPGTYKRMRAGFEGPEQAVLGRNAADCTAVMSNSPGALELLPTKAYKAKGADGTARHWLRASYPGMGEHGKPAEHSVMLGEDDPHQSIYLNNTNERWWRLVKEDLINPAHLDADGKERKASNAEDKFQDVDASDFKRFEKNMRRARALHDFIEDKYHPNTYASYAADADRLAWNEVVWKTRESVNSDVQSATTIGDDLNGAIKVNVNGREVTFDIEGQAGPGDETVPAESASAPTPHVVQIFRHEGKAKGHHSYDHQRSYDSALVQAVTAYSIVKIVADSDWLKANMCHA